MKFTIQDLTLFSTIFFKKLGKRRKSSPWLICTRSGTKFTRSGFNATWCRMQAPAEEKGMLSRFRFHDLKHKGITDFDGDKQQFSGHKSRSMMERYNHGIDRVSTVDKPMKMDK